MQIFGSGQSHVKIWFFEMSKAIPVSIWNEFTSKNVATEALDRNSWILDADHWFSSKSRENIIFVKSYASIYLKWFHSKNMATEPLDRNSWILVADHRFSSKSRENMIFWNVKTEIHYKNVATEALDRNSWI